MFQNPCLKHVGGRARPPLLARPEPNWRGSSILGSCSQVRGKMELNRGIAATSAVMRALCQSVVEKKELNPKTKSAPYLSIYIPTLTYGHMLLIIKKNQKNKTDTHTQDCRNEECLYGCFRRRRPDFVFVSGSLLSSATS